MTGGAAYQNAEPTHPRPSPPDSQRQSPNPGYQSQTRPMAAQRDRSTETVSASASMSHQKCVRRERRHGSDCLYVSTEQTNKRSNQNPAPSLGGRINGDLHPTLRRNKMPRREIEEVRDSQTNSPRVGHSIEHGIIELNRAGDEQRGVGSLCRHFCRGRVWFRGRRGRRGAIICRRGLGRSSWSRQVPMKQAEAGIGA